MREQPVIIEAALCPIRFLGEKPYFTNGELVDQAMATYAAGAAIIHHHHDFNLDVDGTAAEMIEFGSAVLAKYPQALFYGDYTRGDTFEETVAHLPHLFAAGTMTINTIEPGTALVGGLREDGSPYTVYRHMTAYEDANKIAERTLQWDKPLTIGIMEPGISRWAVAQERRGGLPKASLVKFYLCTDIDSFNHDRKGMNYGLAPTKTAVDACAEMLEDTGLPWIVSVYGAAIHENEDLVRHIMEKGGHVRTGVEDACGNTSLSSAQCVSAIAEIAKQVGRPVAKHSETLEILSERRR